MAELRALLSSPLGKLRKVLELGRCIEFPQGHNMGDGIKISGVRQYGSYNLWVVISMEEIFFGRQIHEGGVLGIVVSLPICNDAAFGYAHAFHDVKTGGHCFFF